MMEPQAQLREICRDPNVQCFSTKTLLLFVGKEGFLSSSLSIHFFSKALVGEHRALSFLKP